MIAGLLEVVWVIGLKYTEGFTRPGPTVITLLGIAVKGLEIGTAYAVWTGIGTVGRCAALRCAALLGIMLLGESGLGPAADLDSADPGRHRRAEAHPERIVHYLQCVKELLQLPGYPLFQPVVPLFHQFTVSNLPDSGYNRLRIRAIDVVVWLQ